MTVGVLVMAYGTPRERTDIAGYYTDIRRGRPPTPEQLADLVARYDAIGGTFPLRQATRDQATALAAALDRLSPGGYVVEIGNKHSDPRIDDAVRALAREGADRIVGLVLAPHYSRMSIGDYAEQATRAADEAGLRVDMIDSWCALPAYVEFLAGAVADAQTGLPAGAEVVFTAHSLPARIVDEGDPYPDQLQRTAQAVADRLQLQRWSVGWQSAGRTPEPWLGPDILEVIRDRAAAGAAGLVVCPCGFVADHLEVAYDLDIEAAKLARELGVPFTRTATLGTAPPVISALAALIALAAER